MITSTHISIGDLLRASTSIRYLVREDVSGHKSRLVSVVFRKLQLTHSQDTNRSGKETDDKCNLNC